MDSITARLSRTSIALALAVATLTSTGLNQTTWAADSDSQVSTAVTATSAGVQAPASIAPRAELGLTCSPAVPCTVMQATGGYLLDDGGPGIRFVMPEEN